MSAPAQENDGWSGGTFSLFRTGQRLLGPTAVFGSGSTTRFSVGDEESRCVAGVGGVGVTNVALGLAPAPSSCPESRRALTDGDYPCHPTDTGYWESCPADPEPHVGLSLGGSRCVREVRLWPRCTLHRAAPDPIGVAGALVEVLTRRGWQPCGAAAVPASAQRTGSFPFACVVFGSHVRVRKSGSARLALAEVEVFAGEDQCVQPTVDVTGCRPVVVNVRTTAAAGAMGWAVGGACPALGAEPGALAPSAFYSTLTCLAPGDYQLVAFGDDVAGSGGSTVTLALLDGSTVPVVPALAAKRDRANVAFMVPPGAVHCDPLAPNVGARGCVSVAINVTERDGATNFFVEGTCPVVTGNETLTVCLSAGVYTFVATARYGDGWKGGTVSIGLNGMLDPLIRNTEVIGFGLKVPFNVPVELPSLTPEVSYRSVLCFFAL